jgi:hypothetical protein
MPPSLHPSGASRDFRVVFYALPVVPTLPWWFGEAWAAKAEMRELKREMAAEAARATDKIKRDKEIDTKGKKARPDEMAERMLGRLREQLEVTDDAEWEIIGERIRRVGEIRAEIGKSGAGPKPLPPMKEKAKRSSHSEQEALRAAVKDRLPDAEIRSRLDRAHEVQQKNEARLAQAQAELRAVLTVRQEAVAVLAGLLPP